MKTCSLTTHNRFATLLVLGFLIILGSCANPKKVTYFNNLGEGVIPSSIVNLEPIIQKSDILSINVTSPNPEATVMFNAPNVLAAGTSSNAGPGLIGPSAGYLVSQEGYIDFPGLGKVMAAGLSKQKLKEEITAMLVNSKLLIDPIVTVRYLNYRVTVL